MKEMYKKIVSVTSMVIIGILISSCSSEDNLGNSDGIKKTYTITVEYANVKVSNKIVVKSILNSKNVNIKKSAKKLVLKASLSRVNGKYLAGKKIIFKFNGKKYAAKTNKKGVAKITLKKKAIKKLKANRKYAVKISYLDDSINRIVKVKK
jgi:hypothetical protein